MQGELNAIWDHLLPGFQSQALPDDVVGQENLKEETAKLESHPEKKEK